MSTLKVTFAAVVLVAAFAACTAQSGGEAAAGDESAVDPAAEAQAIRDMSVQWQTAVQARDIEGVMSMFAPEAETIFDGDYESGIEDIREETEEQWTDAPDMTVSWETTAVHLAASGDFAVERGHFTADPDGPGEADEEQGEYVTFYRKIDGRWKVVVDAGTTLVDDDDNGDADDDGDDDDDEGEDVDV